MWRNVAKNTKNISFTVLTYLLTYLLTSWSSVLLEKLTGFSYSRNYPHFMEPEVFYRSNMCPSTAPILSQIVPVHILTSHFLKIHLNIILPPKPVSPKLSLFLRLHNQNLYTPLLYVPFSYRTQTPCVGKQMLACQYELEPWRLKKSKEMQQYAGIYLLLNYSTCFGRPSRPSSGVHKPVIAASGTDHAIWGASFLTSKLAPQIV